MPRIEYQGDEVVFFEDAESAGRRWISVPHWLHLNLSAWQLVTAAREEADSPLPGPPIREIRGTARLTSRRVAVLPDGGEGMAESFSTVRVSIYEGEIPHAELLEARGPIYFAHWPGIDERPYQTEASLSLGLAMPPAQFAPYWSALQLKEANALGLSIELAGYGGHCDALGLRWGPREYDWLDAIFIRNRSRPNVRLTSCAVSAGPPGGAEDLDAACASLTEKLRGEAAPGSNYARALEEGIQSIAKATLSSSATVEDLSEEADRFAGYLQDLRWSLDQTPSEPDQDSGSSDHLRASIWRPFKVQAWLNSGGKPEPVIDHPEVSAAAAGYLDRAESWSSPTLERVLLHALIQAEAIAFGKHLGESIFTEDFGFGGLLKYGDKFDGSLASYGKLRLKRYFRGWGIYLGLWALVALLTWAAMSGDGGSSNAWLGGGAAILATLLLLRAAWAIGWSVFRLFVKDPKVARRIEHLQLLTAMAQLADQFPTITSPQEAAAELQRLESKGAKWPQNTWALMHGAIARGRSYWGPPLSYRL